ncbi:DUF349 domain-containing protein [Robiginitalea sp. IMCC44478]|uniref:DUF349 domain-containing protein n=1 Tax=Robiginitalea sp. IMCC44478 TaxID=3459122 RepID=UPI004041D4B1
MSEEEKKELQPAAGGDQPSVSKESNAEDTSEEVDKDELKPKSGEDADAGQDKPESADPDEEIDESNAEDAEDSENERRHHIPFLDYHSLSMENLVGELQRLLRTEKVQAIRRHVEQIKSEFDLKFQDFIETKKEEFVERGGAESDFHYNSVNKRQFNELYSEYRNKRNQYYRDLEHRLKENLANRLAIIEDLKGLVNMEEDMTTTYNTFKELQQKWRNAGPVPRTQYNDVWRTYQHHVEIFYDFLHLNRELRDLDFKHNLEEKLKLIKRAEALANEEDLNKAFRELQTLHKLWKEEIGPVSKDHREEIWKRFSDATKVVHQRRQEHFQELEAQYETNLANKQQIISDIEKIASSVADNHRGIQKQIKDIEKLRDAFFKAGKVPHKVNEQTWTAFKNAVRSFNRTKNAFYKNLKKDQQENLDKKRELLERALSLKDSEDWESTTPEMKQIQQQWKQIGHVPRKYSDKIWKQFKEACNHYFNRLHAQKDSANAGERENLKEKLSLMDQLKEFKLSGKKEKDLKVIQEFVTKWKEIGHIPHSKRHVNSKFYKILDALFKKMGISRQEAEIIKYGNKIQQLSKEDDARAILQERQFVKRKIEENKNEIRQLENNLEFFSDTSEENPMVKKVIKDLEKQKEALGNWKAKLKKLNILRNSLIREEAAAAEKQEEENGEE